MVAASGSDPKYLPTGHIAYAVAGVLFTARFNAADRSGRERVLALAPAEYEGPRVSPDGRRLAFSTDDRQEAAVWIYDLSEEHAIRRLTFSGRNRLPLWSPDGTRVAFQSDHKGDTSIFVKNVDGAGEAERLTTAPAGVIHIPESWSKDGFPIRW